MKKIFAFLFVTLAAFVSLTIVSCASPKKYEVMTQKEWNSIKESQIISLDNITLDSDSFIKIYLLDDRKKPIRNRECMIYIFFEKPESEEALRDFPLDELETSDKIGRIHAKTNKDGWLYIKGTPYEASFILRFLDEK